MNKNGLAPHTGRIFEGISKLECIKPFVLVGDTALSLELKTRQSEDLDFITKQIVVDKNVIYYIFCLIKM